MKKFKINGGIYNWDSLVIFSTDRVKVAREFNKFLRRNDLEPDHFLTLGKLCESTIGLSALWMPRVPKTPQEHGVLAHEIFHLTSSYMRYTGSWLTESSEESYAYLLSHLTKQIYSKI